MASKAGCAATLRKALKKYGNRLSETEKHNFRQLIDEIESRQRAGRPLGKRQAKAALAFVGKILLLAGVKELLGRILQ